MKYDWQCTNCPWFVDKKCTNHNEENNFCLWEEVEIEKGERNE